MKTLHELPRFDGRLSYLYLERARIDQFEKAVAVHDVTGMTPVPAAALALLMLGPGTSITHEAIKALGDNQCMIAWVGEEGVRLYAHSSAGPRGSANLRKQARLFAHPTLHLLVVKRMYCKRFPEPLEPGLALKQLRGKEGVRVREAYAEASRKFGVPWEGRCYRHGEWNAADPVNRALSAGNSCLYGLVHAAIVAGGFSPGLGFVHAGKQLSFVYDIADLYKADHIVPLAFETASTVLTGVERSMRQACRDLFAQRRLMERIIPDIHDVLNVEPAGQTPEDLDWEEDPARPGALWSPDEEQASEGGVNYGDPDC